MASRNMLRLAPGGDAPTTGTIHLPFVLSYKLTSSDSTINFYNANVPAKLRVIDAWVVMHGAGDTGDKVKLTDGTTDITDDLDVSSASDEDRTTFAQLDDATWEIDKDGTLTIISTSGALAEVFVLCINV